MPRFMNDFCQETKDWVGSYIGASSNFLVMDLDSRLRRLEKTIPTPEQLDKYPSLKEAYEQFLIIQRLTIENEKS